MMAAGYLQVTTAIPSRGEAERLARLAVESRLAAAVHVIGPVPSSYRWKGGSTRSRSGSASPGPCRPASGSSPT